MPSAAMPKIISKFSVTAKYNSTGERETVSSSKATRIEAHRLVPKPDTKKPKFYPMSEEYLAAKAEEFEEHTADKYRNHHKLVKRTLTERLAVAGPSTSLADCIGV